MMYVHSMCILQSCRFCSFAKFVDINDYICIQFRYEELCRTDDDEDPTSLDSGEVRVTPSRPRLRIREDVREQHCRTLRQALHVWLDQYPEDFDDPPNYPCLTQLEAFCRRVLPNSELDIKVHRKASQIRRPQESPPHKLGYPPGSKPPRLVLKSASLFNGGSLNNNSVHAKEPHHDPSLQTSPYEEASQHHHHPHHTLPNQYLDFLDIPEVVFARQLTRMDCVSPAEEKSIQ